VEKEAPGVIKGNLGDIEALRWTGLVGIRLFP
jgi:hypothetical protein